MRTHICVQQMGSTGILPLEKLETYHSCRLFGWGRNEKLDVRADVCFLCMAIGTVLAWPKCAETYSDPFGDLHKSFETPPATKLIKSSIAKPSLRVRRKEYPKRKRCFLSQSIATCCQHANAPANIPCATYTLEKLHAQYCVTNLAKWNPNEHCFLWRNAFWKIPGS